jgi:glucosyl-3-phosphoglycerate synthase
MGGVGPPGPRRHTRRVDRLREQIAVQLATQRWLRSRSFAAADFPLGEVRRLKADHRVSVVLPARDEAATVGAIVRAIRDELQAAGIVDEILVVDSHSVDSTAEVAAAAGARVVAQSAVLPELGDRPGKGEALWKGLAASSGDLVVFLDADLVDFDPAFVLGLLGPLLREPDVHFVKGMYDRPLRLAGEGSPTGGGRVTELVARPLLNAYWPQLAGVVQPLGGEYAGRRAALEQVPFAGGYGVEVGLLVDLLRLLGLDGMAQVDLGRRVHRHQDDQALGRMAMQIQLTASRRLTGDGLAEPGTELVQFRRVDGRLVGAEIDVDALDRPPLRDVAAYRRHSDLARPA